MVIIEKAWVVSAIAIKTDFEALSEKLVKYEKDVVQLSSFLLEKCHVLEKYAKTDIKNASSVNESTKYILDEMVEMERESDRISQLVDHLNVEIIKLRKLEQSLCVNIQQRNPNASLEEIKSALNEKMLKSDT